MCGVCGVWCAGAHPSPGVPGRAHPNTGQALCLFFPIAFSIEPPIVRRVVCGVWCAGGGLQVRIQALVSLGELIPTLDKPCVMDILQTMARCASVDHSPPTLMCIVGVAERGAKGGGYFLLEADPSLPSTLLCNGGLADVVQKEVGTSCLRLARRPQLEAQQPSLGHGEPEDPWLHPGRKPLVAPLVEKPLVAPLVGNPWFPVQCCAVWDGVCSAAHPAPG